MKDTTAGDARDSLPDLTQSDQKYSIGFDVFSRKRRKCAGRGNYEGEKGIPPRYSCHLACESVTVVQKTCPLLYPALIGHCRSSCDVAFTPRDTRLCTSTGSWTRANPAEAEVRSKERGEMHHSTVSTFIDDVSRGAVRGGPLIIINRKWRIHEVVSIIVTCNTEKRLPA